MKKEGKILIIDDDRAVCMSIILLLKRKGFSCRSVNRPNDVEKALETEIPDLILLDMNYTKGKNDGKEGLYWLNRILEVSPSTQVILMTAAQRKSVNYLKIRAFIAYLRVK